MLSETIIALGFAIGAYALSKLFNDLQQLPRLKVQPDPIPRSMHGLNVRSAVPVSDWIAIKKVMMGNTVMRTPKCECCGAAGPLECHEVWIFTWPRTQKLAGLKLLCHLCHMIHHIGFAIYKLKQGEEVTSHFMKVNGIDRKTADRYIKQSFTNARRLNRFSLFTLSKQHRLDLTYLNDKRFGFKRVFTTDERKSCHSKSET